MQQLQSMVVKVQFNWEILEETFYPLWHNNQQGLIQSNSWLDFSSKTEKHARWPDKPFGQLSSLISKKGQILGETAKPLINRKLSHTSSKKISKSAKSGYCEKITRQKMFSPVFFAFILDKSLRRAALILFKGENFHEFNFSWGALHR